MGEVFLGGNAGEWTGRVEISKKEIPGSKLSMYGYIPTYPRLQKNKQTNKPEAANTLHTCRWIFPRL